MLCVKYQEPKSSDCPFAPQNTLVVRLTIALLLVHHPQADFFFIRLNQGHLRFDEKLR